MSPDCDIQPRSAVISREPGEREAVEKFKQHAHKHTHTHEHALTYTKYSGEDNGLRSDSGMPQVTVTVKEHTL